MYKYSHTGKLHIKHNLPFAFYFTGSYAWKELDLPSRSSVFRHMEYSCSHEEHCLFLSFFNRIFSATTGAAPPFQSCFPHTPLTAPHPAPEPCVKSCIEVTEVVSQYLHLLQKDNMEDLLNRLQCPIILVSGQNSTERPQCNLPQIPSSQPQAGGRIWAALSVLTTSKW